jgi:hypothetical protein
MGEKQTEIKHRTRLALMGSWCATCRGMLGVCDLDCPFSASVQCQHIGGEFKSITQRGRKCEKHTPISARESDLKRNVFFMQAVEAHELPIAA